MKIKKKYLYQKYVLELETLFYKHIKNHLQGFYCCFQIEISHSFDNCSFTGFIISNIFSSASQTRARVTSKNYVDTGKLKIRFISLILSVGDYMVDTVKVVLIYKNNLRLGMQKEMMAYIISLNFNLLLVNSNIICHFIHKSII